MRQIRTTYFAIVLLSVAAQNLASAQWTESSNGTDIYTEDHRVFIGDNAEERASRATQIFDVIYNNDGNDMMYDPDGVSPPQNVTFNADHLLKRRTTGNENNGSTVGLRDTPTKYIFYSTANGTFNRFTHLIGGRMDTLPSGQIVNEQNGSLEGLTQPVQADPEIRTNDKRWQFLLDGNDPIEIMIDYGNADDDHNIEVFWSLRMNDTHDYDYSIDDKRSRWKIDNYTELLGSSPEPADWCGIDATVGVRRRKTAVNYESQAVRDQVLDQVAHTLFKYNSGTDADGLKGIELDFMRHAVYFENQMDGLPANQTQLNLMTQLVRDISALCTSYDVKLAISVANSLALNKEIGLDVEAWLTDSQIDISILTAGGYWHVQPWKATVDEIEAVNTDVAIYASILVGANSRFAGTSSSDILKYERAEMIDALEAGVDGVYFFNRYDPKHMKDLFGSNSSNYNTLSNLKSKNYEYQLLIEPPSNQATLNKWFRCGYDRYVNHYRYNDELVNVDGEVRVDNQIRIVSDLPRVNLFYSDNVANYSMINAGTAFQIQQRSQGSIDWSDSYSPFAIYDLGSTSSLTKAKIEIKGRNDGEADLNVDGDLIVEDKVNMTGDLHIESNTPSVLFDNQKFIDYLPFKILHTGSSLEFRRLDNSFNYVAGSIRFNQHGNVTFAGASGEDFKLSINGSLNAPGFGADDVFYDDYNLMPISEVNEFIKSKKHLPGVPSAAETEQGINVSEFEEILLRKVEELTLYIIEKEKRINDLTSKLEQLKNI